MPTQLSRAESRNQVMDSYLYNYLMHSKHGTDGMLAIIFGETPPREYIVARRLRDCVEERRAIRETRRIMQQYRSGLLADWEWCKKCKKLHADTYVYCKKLEMSIYDAFCHDCGQPLVTCNH